MAQHSGSDGESLRTGDIVAAIRRRGSAEAVEKRSFSRGGFLTSARWRARMPGKWRLFVAA